MEADKQAFRVTMSGYSYYLYTRVRGQDRELLAWQWDQRGRSPTTYPHLHVSASSDLLPDGFGWLHIPTSRVLVEDVLEFCITDFELEPRREDWRAVFDRNRETYRERRTQR